MYNNSADIVQETGPAKELSEVMEQVSQAQSAGDWPRAIQLLQGATGRAQSPQAAAQVWNSLGYSYVMDNRLFEAEMALQRGLKLAPESLDLLSNLADLYLRQEDYVQATDYLRQALQVNADDVGVLLSFANCAVQLGDSEAALLAFTRVKTLAPNTAGIDEILRQLQAPAPEPDMAGAPPPFSASAPNPLLAAGQAALDRGDFEAAAREFSWITAQHPNLAAAHAALGSAFLALGNPQAAAPALRRAVELAPEVAQHYNQLAVALYHTGQENEAEATLRRGLEFGPDRPELLNSLAAVYFQQDRLDLATDYLNRVLRLDIDNLDALQLLGHCAIQLETFDVALLAFQRVQALAPETEGLEALLAELSAIVPNEDQPLSVAPVEAKNGHGSGFGPGVSAPAPRPAAADPLPAAWDWDAPPNPARKPASSNCAIIIPADHDPASLPACLAALQQHTAAHNLSVQLLNPPAKLPSLNLPLQTAAANNPLAALDAALDDGATRCALLLSPDVRVTAGWLEQLLAIAESDAAIAVVGPVANAAPAVQRVEAAYRDPEAGLADFARQRAAEYAGQWQPAPHLGGFCLLLRPHAVRVVGGLAKDRPLPEALLDLYDRLQRFGFKLACAQGVYVHHQTLSEAEGAGFDRLADPQAQLQQLLATGQAAVERGDLEAAAREFEAVTQQHPDLAAAYTALGSTLLALGRTAEAIPALRRAAELVPRLAAAHNQLGVALYRLGRQDEAEAALTQARQADPNELEPLLNLTELYREQQRYPEALSIIEQVLTKNPQQPDAIVAFGLISLAVGHVAQAEHAVANLQDAPPDHPGVQALRQALGQATSPAVDSGGETPDQPVPGDLQEQMELALAVGEAAVKLGNFELADREFRRVIDKYPDLAAAHAALGGVLLALDRAEEAVAPLERAIELVPEVAANHNRLGIALFRAGRSGQAEAAFEQARALDPNDVEPLLNLVDLHRSRQQYQAAVEAAKAALALDEANPDVLVAFGILCYELGDPEGAQMAWEQLQPAPADHPGVKALGQLLGQA